MLWYAREASGETERKLLVILMVCLYAGRLGFFLLFNRVIGKAEDARYQELRRSWGTHERWRMFGYFQLQAAAVTAFSLPFLVVIQNPRPPFGLGELAGLLLWIGAVSGEAVSDWQLSRFRARPWNRERVCRDGFWYWSRHPNYFFEWLHWWAYVVMAVGAPGWPLTLIGPDWDGMGAHQCLRDSFGGAAGSEDAGTGLSGIPRNHQCVCAVEAQTAGQPALSLASRSRAVCACGLEGYKRITSS